MAKSRLFGDAWRPQAACISEVIESGDPIGSVAAVERQGPRRVPRDLLRARHQVFDGSGQGPNQVIYVGCA